MLRVFNCHKEISEPNARVFAWGAVSPFVPNNKLKYWAEQCDTDDYQRPTTTGERLSERKKKNHHRGVHRTNRKQRVPSPRIPICFISFDPGICRRICFSLPPPAVFNCYLSLLAGFGDINSGFT